MSEQPTLSLHEVLHLFPCETSPKKPALLKVCHLWTADYSRVLCCSYSLRLRGLQHPRLLCPSASQTPQSLLKFMSAESVRPSNHLILCHSFLLLPSIFPSIRAFSNELALHVRWLKYWSFSINISPSNEYSELPSFRMDWLDLLSVQGTESSPTPQFKSINSSAKG